MPELNLMKLGSAETAEKHTYTPLKDLSCLRPYSPCFIHLFTVLCCSPKLFLYSCVETNIKPRLFNFFFNSLNAVFTPCCPNRFSHYTCSLLTPAGPCGPLCLSSILQLRMYLYFAYGYELLFFCIKVCAFHLLLLSSLRFTDACLSGRNI